MAYVSLSVCLSVCLSLCCLSVCLLSPSPLSNHPPLLPVGTGGTRDATAPALQPGDVVEVVEGDLKNLTGKVLSLEGDTVTVRPHHKDLQASSPSPPFVP